MMDKKIAIGVCFVILGGVVAKTIVAAKEQQRMKEVEATYDGMVH